MGRCPSRRRPRRRPYRLLSRTDQDMTSRYPELVPLADAYADEELVLDGELVTLLDGKPSFKPAPAAHAGPLPHRRPGQSGPCRVLRLRRPAPRRPLTADPPLPRTARAARRARPQRPDLADTAGLVRRRRRRPSHQPRTRPGRCPRQRLDSTYRPGARTRDWSKPRTSASKKSSSGGWTAGQGRREGTIGALLLGIPTPRANSATSARSAPASPQHSSATSNTAWARSVRTDHPSPPATASPANTPVTPTGHTHRRRRGRLRRMDPRQRSTPPVLARLSTR